VIRFQFVDNQGLNLIDQHRYVVHDAVVLLLFLTLPTLITLE
jgi:hypothetical protein